MTFVYFARFQYILNAATSPATRMSEETLTYLNQGNAHAYFAHCDLFGEPYVVKIFCGVHDGTIMVDL